MANAVRLVTVQRGVDPTGCTLVPFGGAGPLHAGELARELGHPRARGAAGARDSSARSACSSRTCAPTPSARTWRRSTPDGTARARRAASTSSSATRSSWLDRERVPASRRRLERWLDLRYVGQNFELLVPVPDETLAGRRLRGAPPAVPSRRTSRCTASPPRTSRCRSSTLRLGRAAACADPPMLARLPRGGADPSEAASASRRGVYVDDEQRLRRRAPVYDRARLLAGQRIAGPAVVEQFDCDHRPPAAARRRSSTTWASSSSREQGSRAWTASRSR